MPYFLCTLTSEYCTIQPKEVPQSVCESYTIPLASADLATMLQQLKDAFVQQEMPYAGGLLSAVSDTFYATYGLDKNPDVLIALLAETWNLPLLTWENAQTYDNLQAAFADAYQTLSWQIQSAGLLAEKQEYALESLLTIGNGFMALRGTTPEMTISTQTYPATYLAGLYNQATSIVSGEVVTNEDFVNAPNCQFITCKVADSPDWLQINAATTQQFYRKLDLKSGLFFASMLVTDAKGRQMQIQTKKVVNMQHMHQYSIQYQITPLNFSEALTVRSEMDASVYNFNVVRYRHLTAKHFHVTNAQASKTTGDLTVTTNQSQLSVRQQMQLAGDCLAQATVKTRCLADKIVHEFTFPAQAKQTYTFEKTVYVTTSMAQTVPFEQPVFASFQEIAAESQAAWAALWAKMDIELAGDFQTQKLLRLQLYHLLVSASPEANANLDVSVTARGLHGEAYRGHIFWDELFILPFFGLHFPALMKQLLLYRYKRLGKAKENARAQHYAGAMFPWQSGLDGSEQTQTLHLNPLNGQWNADHSILQRHVSLAIAYNIWFYWHLSEDEDFLKTDGLEMLLEIAQFWRSAATYDETTQRYHIKHVMGPDEFHEKYPQEKQGGLTDNAYTNGMVVWLFDCLAQLLPLLSDQEQAALRKKTNLTDAHWQQMQQIKQALTLEVNEQGIIAQFQGYFELKEIDWTQLKQQHKQTERVDRILKAAGNSPDAYQVAKQADTLMLFYNLDEETLQQVFQHLQYPLTAQTLSDHFQYYLARTSHGSTLSRIVHAQLAEKIGLHELAWTFYQAALASDYRDTQGGTTAEGIHTGVMAASLMMTLTAYAGVQLKKQTLTLQPNLPQHWQKIAFQLQHKGITYQLQIEKNQLTLTANQDTQIVLMERLHPLIANEPTTFSYQSKRQEMQ